MLHADQFGDVGHVPRHVGGGGRVVSQECRHARQANDAAGRRAGFDLLVGDVAAMLGQGQRIGVTEDDRLL